eukprot:GILK01000456.1.p1 GENE.GILK01000456.1~~GILK01000456.1.p1  ORF type:complete len:751 (-),score=124.60 GILK01000456.1:354-2513(-)
MAALCATALGGNSAPGSKKGKDGMQPPVRVGGVRVGAKKGKDPLLVMPKKEHGRTDVTSSSVDLTGYEDMVAEASKPLPNYKKQFIELACSTQIDKHTIFFETCLERYRSYIAQSCLPALKRLPAEAKKLVETYEFTMEKCNELTPKCKFMEGTKGLPLGPVASFLESYYSNNLGFHSGNMVEHGVWSAKAMAWLFDTRHPYTQTIHRTVAADLTAKKELLTAIAFLHDLGKVGHPQQRQFYVVLHHFHYGYEMLTGRKFPQCFYSEDDNPRTPAHPETRANEDPSRWRVERFEVDRCVARYGPDNCPTEEGKGKIFDIQSYLETVLFPALKIAPKDYDETSKMIAVLVGIHTGYGKVLQNRATVEHFNHWLSNLDCLVQELGYNDGVLDLKMVYYAVLVNAADVRGSVSISHAMDSSPLAIPAVCHVPSYPEGERPDVNKLPYFHNEEVLSAFNPHGWLMNYVQVVNQGAKTINREEAGKRGLDLGILARNGWTIAEVVEPEPEPKPKPTLTITIPEEEDYLGSIQPATPGNGHATSDMRLPSSTAELVTSESTPELGGSVRRDTDALDASHTVASEPTNELDPELGSESAASRVEDQIGERVIESAVHRVEMDAQPREPTSELDSSLSIPTPESSSNLDAISRPLSFEVPVEADRERELSARERFERESAQRRADAESSSGSYTLEGLDLAMPSNGKAAKHPLPHRMRRTHSFSQDI